MSDHYMGTDQVGLQEHTLSLAKNGLRDAVDVDQIREDSRIHF